MGADGDSTESSVAVGGGEEVTLNIRCTNGSKFSVRTSLGSTVEAFKAVLAQNCDVPADQQRLIYKGRILKGDQTLDSYGTYYMPFLPNSYYLINFHFMWINLLYEI